MGKPKGNGEIDAFLKEMIDEQASGANVISSAPSLFPVSGSFPDASDGSTTNLYVGNLASSVTEEKLAEVFGIYGNINSVKVMWPRTAEEKAKKRNCGFVSYMKRSDAEDALVLKYLLFEFIICRILTHMLSRTSFMIMR